MPRALCRHDGPCRRGGPASRTARWKAPTIRAPTAARPGYKVRDRARARPVTGASIPPHSVLCVVPHDQTAFHGVAVCRARRPGSLTVRSGRRAHPHVWVTMKSELVYAPTASVTGVRHAWTFDDMFSTFATQGIDSQEEGRVHPRGARAARQDQRHVAQGLRLLHHRHGERQEGRLRSIRRPTTISSTRTQMLTLHFTLPFKTPVQGARTSRSRSTIRPISSTSRFAEKDIRSRWSARRPAASWSWRGRRRWTPRWQRSCSQMSPDQKLDPSELLGAQFANTISVKCS